MNNMKNTNRLLTHEGRNFVSRLQADLNSQSVLISPSIGSLYSRISADLPRQRCICGQLKRGPSQFPPHQFSNWA